MRCNAGKQTLTYDVQIVLTPGECAWKTRHVKELSNRSRLAVCSW